MSTQVSLTANQSAVCKDSDKNFNNHSDAIAAVKHSHIIYSSSYSYADEYLLVSFPPVAAEYKYKKIEGSTFQIFARGEHSRDFPNRDQISFHPLNALFSESTVTYQNDYHSILNTDYDPSLYFDLPGPDKEVLLTSELMSEAAALAALKYGVVCVPWNAVYSEFKILTAYIHTSRGTTPPKLTVTLSDEDVKTSFTSVTPAAGTVLNRVQSNLFTSRIGYSGYSYETPTVTKTTFRWRVHGQSEVHEVAVGNGYYSYTAPAGTFPGGSVDYQFVLDVTPGGAVSSDWVTVTFTDTISQARGVSPRETLVDGDAPVVFAWEHINESGAKQTKAELQISADASAWQDLITVSSSDTTATVPAGKISTGTWYWRVRTYNLDGVAGSWSTPLRFLAVAHPSMPKVMVTSLEPRPSIQWQTSEQEAYQLQMEGLPDGQTYQITMYGPDKTWRCPFYLPDGPYTVQVRSQNQYGLWSPWGQVNFQITNTPGPEITLSVTTGYDAQLAWTGAGFDFFLVYRDGVPIARTTEHSYTDHWSAGQVVYQVRGCYLARSTYSISNEAAADVLPEVPAIAAVETGEWLLLPLSDEQHRTIRQSLGREISGMQLSGHRYPAAELAEFYSESLSMSCAFVSRAECERLEALVGRLVCLKTEDGSMVIGYLDKLTKAAELFYTTYSFSVEQTDFQEEIDLDTGNLL